MKIRVLLVEDQKIMQKYFASMVQGDERFLLVDVLNDGEKAVSYCNHTVVRSCPDGRPDLPEP